MNAGNESEDTSRGSVADTPGEGPEHAKGPPGDGHRPVRVAVERGVTRVVDEVIDQVVADLAVKNQDVVAAIREALREAADRQMERLSARPLIPRAGDGGLAVAAAPTSVATSSGFGTAIDTGINAVSQVQNLGFVEFTAGLINGTFDAITSATVRQMDAYSKLIADLAKSLSQFQAENVSDAQINAYLADHYPDGQGETVVRSNYTFTDTPKDDVTGNPGKLANAKFQEVVESLIAQTVVLKDPAQRLSREASSLNIPATDTAVCKFVPDQIAKIRTALGASLATSMIDHLRAMAQQGMARIVITTGRILSKLTFNVTATSQQATQSSKFHQDSAGAYVRGGANWGYANVTAGASWNQLNVNTVNQQSFDTTTMSAEIIGQVELQFKTDYFPQLPA